MKLFSFLLAACLPSSAALAQPVAAAAGGPVAGRFDSYTFTMSWQPAFCEGKPTAPECKSESPGRFDASNLALHGLWPDKNGDARHAYGYCGVDAATRALDNPATWCRLPEPPLSGATRDALATAMPGVASCLDHHEWTKHGTCSGLAADDYFALAAALIQQVAATNFGRFLAANAGKTVSSEDALAAFERDFGAGARNLVSLDCANVRGAQALLEVRLHMPASLAPGATLAKSLIAAGDRGNCPSSFLLDPVPAR